MSEMTEILLDITIFLLVVFWMKFGFQWFKRRGERWEKSVFFLGGHVQEKLPTLIKPMAGVAMAAVIFLINPISDWIYYMGVFGCMGTVLWAIMDIIRQHNRLTLRKLPQLGRRGGDEGE